MSAEHSRVVRRILACAYVTSRYIQHITIEYNSSACWSMLSAPSFPNGSQNIQTVRQISLRSSHCFPLHATESKTGYTLLGSNISPSQGTFEDDVPFPKVEICYTRKINIELPKNGCGWKMNFLFNWVILRFQPLIFRGVVPWRVRPWKLTNDNGKPPKLKMYFLLKMVIFECHVSFRVCFLVGKKQAPEQFAQRKLGR